MTTNCNEKNNYPVIFIICDQMLAIHNLPSSIRKHYPGYNKWSKQCVNLLEHTVTSIPCSPSRATIFTGKNCNITQMIDNNNNSWQNDLLTVEQGLPTIGTYFKHKGYKTRYMGKFHLTKQLDPGEVLKFKPTIATQDYLQDYDFDIFDKDGDAGYNNTGGFFTDVDLLQKRLPNGNDSDKCDYYDENSQIGYDGVFPYLIKRHEENDNKFLLVVNFRNPHDITYNDTITIEENPTTETPTLQISGNPDQNFHTNSAYNENYRLFYENELIYKDSIQNNNPLNSKTNDDPVYIGIAYYLATQYYGYGISIDNLLSYKYYQNTYLQCLKQLDSQLEELFNFLTDFNYFNKAVIILGSDHGEMNGSHGLVQKGNLIYKTAWQVTTFISSPNIDFNYKGYKYDKTTSNIQLVPTAMLLSETYTEKQIKCLGLMKPIFKFSCSEKYNENKQFGLYNKDFKNLKTNFSIGYGSIFLPLLRSLQNEMINTELDKYFPRRINYFTMPCFLVAADIRYKCKLYNVGYYFSLYNLFLTNFEKINIPDIIPPSPVPLIMYNSISSGGVAFVGTPLQIYQQFFGNVYFVDQYFQNVKIEPFIGNLVNEYTPLILPPSIYGTKIYANSNIFTEEVVSSFIGSLVPGPIAEPSSTLYDAGVSSDGSLGGIYCYYGTKEYIKFILETNPILKTWITPTIVDGLLPQYDVYVMNDPIYQQAQLYAKNELEIKNVIEEFNLINYIQLLFKLPKLQMAAIIAGTINYTVFDSTQFIFNAALKSLGNFTLPGQNMSVQELLIGGYQVQVFNNTDDKDEFYNLADTSRLNDNINIINKLLEKLNDHIQYHNMETIYMSLPRQLLFTQILNNTKSFNNRETPLIYNYSILQSNFYRTSK